MNWRVHLRRTRRAIGRPLARVVMPGVLRLLSKTWKSETLGAENLERAAGADGGHFMALWHGRMILGLRHHGGGGKIVLVSTSDDGELAKRVLRDHGYEIIRGSSSRRGSRAMREMITALRDGRDVVITPDGPRGPRHAMNPGPAFLARETGAAIVPIGFGVDRAWHLRSWDRFTIPKPWARIAIRYGSPIRIVADADEARLEAGAVRLAEALTRAETEAFEVLGRPVDW